MDITPINVYIMPVKFTQCNKVYHLIIHNTSLLTAAIMTFIPVTEFHSLFSGMPMVAKSIAAGVL